MPPTTSDALRKAYHRAAAAVGVPADTLDTALWEQDLDVVPHLVGDERQWRLAIGGTEEARVLDSEELLGELGFALLAHPQTSLALRPAEQDEVAAFMLFGADGLSGLDERRRRQEELVGREVVEALTIAIGAPADASPAADGRFRLDEIAVELDAIAVRLRELSVAAERPSVPVELRKLCDQLDSYATGVDGLAQSLAETDAIISENRPLRPTFSPGRPWGLRALETPPDSSGKRSPTVLSNWQICSLARPLRWGEPEEPGIPYLTGIAGLPGLERWESTRAADRRAAERVVAIRQEAARQPCTSCSAEPGKPCTTRTGRVAEMFHRPRLTAATAVVDRASVDTPGEDRADP
ncbi:zinc finger domain-containing protein [Nonomuraea angiospora]|uniref:zinc finger domain-containing protein n=1 Tax=Nonomuraea angiospora TaxID=46172 RepID=UPI0029B8B521|nr:hypothetical protein [Nonomuraea angiospora]MDX3106057.1 hypothetical protein [Nonomuraea angiospora]